MAFNSKRKFDDAQELAHEAYVPIKVLSPHSIAASGLLFMEDPTAYQGSPHG
jgi:hypothetical protein